MVFHTAPPQPASKALWICAPELVGGAEASQNGLGDLMPAKLVRRSAMFFHLARRERRQMLMDCLGGQLAILYSHDGGSHAGRANTIADCIDAGYIGLEARVYVDKTFLGFQAQLRGQCQLVLTDGLDDLIGRKHKLRTLDRRWRRPAGCVRRAD